MCCIVVIGPQGYPVKVYGPFPDFTAAHQYRDTLNFTKNTYV